MLYTQRTSQAILVSLVAMLMIAGIAPVSIKGMHGDSTGLFSPAGFLVSNGSGRPPSALPSDAEARDLFEANRPAATLDDDDALGTLSDSTSPRSITVAALVGSQSLALPSDEAQYNAIFNAELPSPPPPQPSQHPSSPAAFNHQRMTPQSTNTSNASLLQMNALRQAASHAYNQHMARCQQQQQLPHSQAYPPLSSSSMLTDDQRAREQLIISIQQLATRASRMRQNQTSLEQPSHSQTHASSSSSSASTDDSVERTDTVQSHNEGNDSASETRDGEAYPGKSLNNNEQANHHHHPMMMIASALSQAVENRGKAVSYHTFNAQSHNNDTSQSYLSIEEEEEDNDATSQSSKKENLIQYDNTSGANTCTKCSKTWATVTELNVHMKHKHTKGEQCTVCYRKFYARSSFSAHMNTHTTRFKCNFCNEFYGQSTGDRQQHHQSWHDNPASQSSQQSSATLYTYQPTQAPFDQTHTGASPLTHQPLTTTPPSDTGTQHHAENTAPTQGAELDDGDTHRIQVDVIPALPSSTDQSSSSVTQAHSKNSDTERANKLIATLKGIEKAREDSADTNSFEEEEEEDNPEPPRSKKLKTAHSSQRNSQDGSTRGANTCTECDKTWGTARELNAHMSTEHMHKDDDICLICRETYQSRDSLASHVNVHTEKFKCQICGYCTQSNSALEAHGVMHTGKKPYSCSKCQRPFTQSGSKNRHERSCKATAPHNQGKKPYSCSKCPRTFTQSGSKNRHERSCTATAQHNQGGGGGAGGE